MSLNFKTLYFLRSQHLNSPLNGCFNFKFSAFEKQKLKKEKHQCRRDHALNLACVKLFVVVLFIFIRVNLRLIRTLVK